LASLSPWFAVVEVGPGTLALLEPRHYEEPISYLILGNERAVLFDTGMGIADIRAEVERLTSLPVTVINSHSHYDHVGDDYRFAAVWAFDEAGEVARIEQGRSRAECIPYMPPASYLELPAGFDPAEYEIRPATVTRRLHHLEEIQLGGRVLTVHHTPGHSPGSICLFDSLHRLLFTGDTFYPGLMYAHFPDSDFGAYVRSMRYLVKLLAPVRHLCPAHNEAYVPKEALVRVLAAFEQIAAGRAQFYAEEEGRVYLIDPYGVMLPAPPAD